MLRSKTQLPTATLGVGLGNLPPRISVLYQQPKTECLTLALFGANKRFQRKPKLSEENGASIFLLLVNATQVEQ